MNDRCLLGKDRTSQHCRGACGTCGWNPDIAKARSEEIATNGLAVGPNGVRRLIVRKEETNG